MPLTDLRDGLTRLITWLTKNPHIPVDFLHYADGEGAEVVFPAGRFDSLDTAADIADALTRPQIEVTDPHDKRITFITVRGLLVDHHQDPLEIVAGGNIFDDARKALLAALGTSPIPNARVWETTADALRAITAGRRTQ